MSVVAYSSSRATTRQDVHDHALPWAHAKLVVLAIATVLAFSFRVNALSS